MRGVGMRARHATSAAGVGTGRGPQAGWLDRVDRQAQPGCVAPPSELVGWWSGDGHTADQTDGTPAALRNGAALAAGLVGQAFAFDGVDDALQVGDRAKLRMTNQFTFEAWIYPTAGGPDGIIVNKEGEYEIARYPDGTIRWAVANAAPGWTWVDSGFVAP